MNLKREPAVIIGALEALAIGLIGIAAYVFAWDAELTALVLALVAPAIVLLGAVATRSRVTPVE